MECESLILSLDSPWFEEKIENDQLTKIRWELPSSIQGSNVSLSNYSICAEKKYQPIKLCCNVILKTWLNPNGSFGDVYHGKAVFADDRWEMDGIEFRTIEIT